MILPAELTPFVDHFPRVSPWVFHPVGHLDLVVIFLADDLLLLEACLAWDATVGFDMVNHHGNVW